MVPNFSVSTLTKLIVVNVTNISSEDVNLSLKHRFVCFSVLD